MTESRAILALPEPKSGIEQRQVERDMADWIDPMANPCYPNNGFASIQGDVGSRAVRH